MCVQADPDHSARKESRYSSDGEFNAGKQTNLVLEFLKRSNFKAGILFQMIY